VFVSVGSTHFDSLVDAVLSDETLERLYEKGYRQIVIQAGESGRKLVQPDSSWANKFEIDIWKYKPSLTEEFEQADLVISHAGVLMTFRPKLRVRVLISWTGSGTILEVLRIPKSLITVPNPTLLHNHQEELAKVLHSRDYLVATTVKYGVSKRVICLSHKFQDVFLTPSIDLIPNR